MKFRHLIDTGSEISVFPANSKDYLHEPVFKLKVEYGNWSPHTVADTFILTWVYTNPFSGFVFAQTFMPIIGTVLLQPNLRKDASKQQLVCISTDLSDCETSFSGCRLRPVTVSYTIDPYYQQISDKQPEIYQTRLHTGTPEYQPVS